MDAIVDPDEPMLPPTRRQNFVDNLAKALAHGVDGRAGIVRALHEEPAMTSLRD